MLKDDTDGNEVTKKRLFSDKESFRKDEIADERPSKRFKKDDQK